MLIKTGRKCNITKQTNFYIFVGCQMEIEVTFELGESHGILWGSMEVWGLLVVLFIWKLMLFVSDSFVDYSFSVWLSKRLAICFEVICSNDKPKKFSKFWISTSLRNCLCNYLQHKHVEKNKNNLQITFLLFFNYFSE